MKQILSTLPPGKNTTIVAIDPGVSTGVAYGDTDNYMTFTVQYLKLRGLWQFLYHQEPWIIVLEQFKGAILDKYRQQTIEVIGGVKAIASLTGTLVVEPEPAARMAWKTSARRYLVQDKQRFTDHQIDALAHMMAFRDDYK